MHIWPYMATNSAEIVERVRGIMAAIPTSLIIESCVFLLVSYTKLAKKMKKSMNIGLKS